MISDLYFLKKTKSEIVGSFLYIFYFFFHKTKPKLFTEQYLKR